MSYAIRDPIRSGNTVIAAFSEERTNERRFDLSISGCSRYITYCSGNGIVCGDHSTGTVVAMYYLDFTVKARTGPEH